MYTLTHHLLSENVPPIHSPSDCINIRIYTRCRGMYENHRIGKKKKNSHSCMGYVMVVNECYIAICSVLYSYIIFIWMCVDTIHGNFFIKGA